MSIMIMTNYTQVLWSVYETRTHTNINLCVAPVHFVLVMYSRLDSYPVKWPGQHVTPA